MRHRIPAFALALSSSFTIAWTWPGDVEDRVSEGEEALADLESAFARTDDPIERFDLLARLAHDEPRLFRAPEDEPHTVPAARLAQEQRLHELVTALHADLDQGIREALDDGRWATAAALATTWLDATGRYLEEDAETRARLGSLQGHLDSAAGGIGAGNTDAGNTDALALDALATYAAHMPVLRLHGDRGSYFLYFSVSHNNGGDTPVLIGAWAQLFWRVDDLTDDPAWMKAWVDGAESRGAPVVHVWLEDVDLATSEGTREVTRATGRRSPEWLAWQERSAALDEGLRDSRRAAQANTRCWEGHWEVVESSTRTEYGNEAWGRFVRAGIPQDATEKRTVTDYVEQWSPGGCEAIDADLQAELDAAIAQGEAGRRSAGPEPLPYETTQVHEDWSLTTGKARVSVAWQGEERSAQVEGSSSDADVAHQALASEAAKLAVELIRAQPEPPWMADLPERLTDTQRDAERRHYQQGLDFEHVLVPEGYSENWHTRLGGHEVGLRWKPGFGSSPFDAEAWGTAFALNSLRANARSLAYCRVLPPFKELPRQDKGPRELWLDEEQRLYWSPEAEAARADDSVFHTEPTIQEFGTAAAYRNRATGPCSLYLELWE